MQTPHDERPTPRRCLMLCLAFALAVGGCGGEDPPTMTEDPITAVDVSPGTSTLDGAGSTVQLGAVAMNSSGATVSGASFTWSSSDVTVVTVDATGLATAAGPNGSATITATTSGVMGSAMIDVVTGPNGGIVSAAAGQVTLSIPSGAVSTPVTVTVSAVASPPPSPTLVANTAFDFGPDGTTFAQPVRMTIGYDPADFPSGVVESDLRLHRLNGSVWEEVAGSTPDPAMNTVSGDVDSFSQYAVAGIQTDFFSGSGTTHLLSVDFTATHSYIDANDNYVWLDEPNDVRILAFPVLGNLTTVSVVRDNVVPGRTWTAFQIGGVPGATTSGGTTVFADVVVSENITGPTTLTLNGALTEPTIKIPPAPQNVAAAPLDQNVSITWDAVSGADSYNLYMANEAGVTPENYSTLTGGVRVEGATSPYTSPTPLPGGTPVFAIVVAVNAAGEGTPSSEVSATPTGGGASIGSLDLSGSGAALLPATTFEPTTASGGSNGANYLWADGGSSELLILVERVGMTSDVFWVTAYGPNGLVWTVNDFNGVAGGTWGSTDVTLTNVSLTETSGGGTTLTLNGTLEQAIVSGEAGNHGSLTVGGTDGSPPAATLSFDGWTTNFNAGELVFTDTGNNVTLYVTISDMVKGVAAVQVVQGGTSWLETTFSNPLPDVAVYGNMVVFTGQQVTRLLSTPFITLTGTLIF